MQVFLPAGCRPHCSVLEEHDEFYMFLFQLLQNIKKGESKRAKFSHPNLSCQNGGKKKEEGGLCDNTV